MTDGFSKLAVQELERATAQYRKALSDEAIRIEETDREGTTREVTESHVVRASRSISRSGIATRVPWWHRIVAGVAALSGLVAGALLGNGYYSPGGELLVTGTALVLFVALTAWSVGR